MKKNVIAVMLSLVMAVGSVGTVPVFAAEAATAWEAAEAEPEEAEVEETEIESEETENSEIEAVAGQNEESAEEIQEISEEEVQEQEEETSLENEAPAEEDIDNEEASQEEEIEEAEESVETEEEDSLENEAPAEEDIDNGEASQEEEIEEAEESVETEEGDSLEDETPAEEGSETTQEECEQQIDENTAVVEEEKSALIDAADEQEESVSSDAARNVVESGTCGDNLTWTLDGEGTLIISGTGEMSSSPWRNSYSSDITQAVIENGVKNIGNDAFALCNDLTSISIPDSVTSIGNKAFHICSNLTSINIPDSVTSIGDTAFCWCSSLTSISIPDSVTSIGYNAFAQCKDLTSISIPDSVTRIGYAAFDGCSSLTSITIPDKVTDIEEDTFSGCCSLENITIPDRVTYIGGYAFFECSSLKSITIPDRVTYVGRRAFADCSSLESITLPDGVTLIEEGTFKNCDNLKSIKIPNGVKKIGEDAFYRCSSLTDIYYAGTKAEWDAIEGSEFIDDMDCVLHTKVEVYDDVHAEKITLNKTSATIVKGKTLQLKAAVTPADATDGKVTWKSGNTKVATVNSAGKVTAVSAGTATITAVTGNGSIKADCTVKVVNPYTVKFDKNVDKINAKKVTLSPSSKSVNPGSTMGTPPTPEYSGYYFLGWYTSRTTGTKVTASTKPSKSMTVYAHWVKRQSLKKAAVTVASCTYNTKAQKPKVTVKLGSKTLKEGTDYTLTYASNKNASKKASVTVKGKKAYNGSVKKTFTINQRDISKSPVSITLKKNKFGYTGKTIKPGYTVAITVGGKAVNLANGTDFTVAYKNNVKIGTASIVFKGKGNYKGTKTLKFYILKKATVTLNLNKGSNSRVTPVLPKGSKNTVEILAGEKIGKIPTPTRKGYTFVGWFTTPKATGGTQIKPEKTRFDAGETKNQTIYARWKKNVYKITFKYDGNGLGLYCPFSTPKERTYTVEDTVTLPVLTSEYARFNGWKNTPGPVNSDKLIKKIGEKATTGNQVLYLDYTLYKYSIEFSGSDGGTVSNGSKQYETMLETHALPKAEFLPPAGKTFDKWYCTEDGKYYEDGATINRLTTQDGKVFHFVAVWKDEKGMQVVNYAREWVGKIPYNRPGSGSYCVVSELTSTDCSGFVCGVYLYFGVNLWPKKGEIRKSPLVTNIGTTDYNQAKPGDIIWWEETKTGLGDGHVAIYAGDGYMIEETSGGHDGVYGNVMVSLVSRLANNRPVSGIFRVFND